MEPNGSCFEVSSLRRWYEFSCAGNKAAKGWQVQMRHGDKVLNFGCHKNEIEAALVYDKNARRIKGAKYAF